MSRGSHEDIPNLPLRSPQAISTSPSPSSAKPAIQCNVCHQAAGSASTAKLAAKASVAQHDAPILAVAWAPTVSQGITSDRGGSIITWSPHQAQELHRCVSLLGHASLQTFIGICLSASIALSVVMITAMSPLLCSNGSHAAHLSTSLEVNGAMSTQQG